MCVDLTEDNDHVTDELFDYLEQRLSPARARLIREHLADCAHCADVFSAAEVLHRDVLESGARHLTPERLITLGNPAVSTPNPDEQTHLAKCSLCRDHLSTLRSLSSADDLLRDDAVTGHTPQASDRQDHWSVLRDRIRELFSRQPTLRLGALGAVAAGILLLIWLPRADDTARLTELARIAPLDVQWSRDVTSPSEFERVLHSGLQAYRANDYAAAVGFLNQANVLEPASAEVLLFLGSTRLLQGQIQQAVNLLQRAAGTTDDSQLLQEIRWQLANAHLAAGDGSAAKILLEQIVSAQDSRQPDASMLLRELEAQ